MSGGAVAGASIDDEEVRDNWDSSDDGDNSAVDEEKEEVRENWDSSDDDVRDSENSDDDDDDRGVRGGGGEEMKHPAAGAGGAELVPGNGDIVGTVDEGVRAEDRELIVDPLAAAGSSNSSFGQVVGEEAGGACGGSTQGGISRDEKVGEDATASSSSGAAVDIVNGGKELPSSRTSESTTVDAKGGGGEATSGSSSMRWRAGGEGADDKRWVFVHTNIHPSLASSLSQYIDTFIDINNGILGEMKTEYNIIAGGTLPLSGSAIVGCTLPGTRGGKTKLHVLLLYSTDGALPSCFASRARDPVCDVHCIVLVMSDLVLNT